MIEIESYWAENKEIFLIVWRDYAMIGWLQMDADWLPINASRDSGSGARLYNTTEHRLVG